MMSGRKRGIALPMVLVTLLLGAVLVYVTFDVVSNHFSSSENVVNDVQLYNAAQDGIEKGKVWLLKARADDNKLPRSGQTTIAKSDLGGSEEDYYKVLIVEDDAGTSADFTVSEQNISVRVRIYDMDYSLDPGMDSDDIKEIYNTAKGFPPILVFDAGESEGMSTRMWQSYASSNRGEGTTGSGAEVIKLGYYLIRSTAAFEDKTKTVEEALVLRL